MKHKSWSSFQTVFVSTGDKTLFLSDTIFSRNNNKTKSSKNFRVQKELLVILNLRPGGWVVKIKLGCI